jgi:hypothetical protein
MNKGEPAGGTPADRLGGKSVAVWAKRLSQTLETSSAEASLYNKINEVAEGMGFEPTIRG